MKGYTLPNDIKGKQTLNFFVAHFHIVKKLSLFDLERKVLMFGSRLVHKQMLVTIFWSQILMNREPARYQKYSSNSQKHFILFL